MMCYTVNSMAVRMKYGNLPISAFVIFPLNYGTIPQAEKQEEEASFCLDGAYFSVSGLGSGAGEGQVSAKNPHPILMG